MVKSYPELMPNRYQLNHDIEARLNGCIIRYKGVPVYSEMRTNKNLLLHHLPLNNKFIEVKPSDPGIDISSIELGFCNSTAPDFDTRSFSESKFEANRVLYSSRAPKKVYRQGLHSHNTTSVLLGRDQSYPCNIVSDHGFIAMLLDIYPSFDLAMRVLRPGNPVAISRDIALSKDRLNRITLYSRNEEVGFIYDGVLNILPSKSSWIYKKMLGNLPVKFKE